MLKYIVAISLLLGASPAFAATIDFTSAEFAAAEGASSYTTTIDGVGVTIRVAPADRGATIEHTSDGLGVDFQDGFLAARQIEGEEVLTIEFDTLVDVSEISVTNLYDWGTIQIEVGTYTIDGVTTEFEAENLNGDLTVAVNADPTTTISFRAQGDWSWFGDSGFTLESISFSSLGPAAQTPELDPNAGGAAVALVVGASLMVSERRRHIA